MKFNQHILTYILFAAFTLSIFGADNNLINSVKWYMEEPSAQDSGLDSAAYMPMGDSVRVREAMPGNVAGDELNDSNSVDALADSISKLSWDLLDSLGLDSHAAGSDDALFMSHLDSLKQLYGKPQGKGVQWNDSIARVQDSINAAKKESPLEAPVQYTGKDSVVFFMDTKNAYIYGEGQVNYETIQLESEKIQMNMDSSIVHAVGMTDSVGKLYGTPIFKDGGDEYDSETMSYNFKTKKGFITNVYTQQQDGYVTSFEAKKGADDELYLRRGRYTTCDEEHPHFYIALSRAKVHTGKSVFSGPAWLVIEDVPIPLGIPFAYFPFTSKYSSGIIMPTYGDEQTRGFYLRDGGYYFAINDMIDAKLTGEIFTKGSWGVGLQTNYKWRYKFSGNFYFNYQVTKEGEKNMPDYSVTKNFKLQWTHRQDPKFSPNSSFSASINFATQSYERNNLTSLYNPVSYSQSTRTSSMSYSHNFPKIGLSLSASMNLSQNMRDSSIAVSFPNISISLARVYPFKRKHARGKERWYEKIALSYTGTLSNSINTKENKLLHSNLLKDWRNGMKHSIPISASFNVLKYINITPSFNFTDRMYSNKVKQSWDSEKQMVQRDTVFGFYNVYDFNLSVSANTKIYGFYKPLKQIFGDKIQMIRHVITPTVSFSYAPDFSSGQWGFYDTYTRTDLQGNVTQVQYSPYSGGIYGVPGKGKTGNINMDLSNNLEMKIKSNKDSTGVKKISLIDELGASLSYNMAAKEQQWSNLSTRIRLKYGKFTLNLNAVFNTYAYEFDKNGNVRVGNRTEWSYGRFGRFQGISKNLSYSFNNSSWKTLKEKWDKLFNPGKEKKEEAASDDGEEQEEDTRKRRRRANEKEVDEESLDADGYMKFKIPWSFSISYGISMAEDRSAEINIKNMRYPYKLTHNLNFSGSIKIATNWNISASSGWDFTRKRLSMTTVNISRDMHCFDINCSLVFGTFTSYNISLRAKASTLTDALKYDKRSSYSSAIRWY